jgi:hypothetical protein
MPHSLTSILSFFLGFLLSFSPALLKAQEAPIQEVSMETYVSGFDFNEGIYRSFEEFRNNAPSIQGYFEKRGGTLYLQNDTSAKMEVVNPEKVWGYSQAGNIYVSLEDAFWRIINIGQLSQFSAIVISTIRTVDAFGFPTETQTRSMEQLFLDMNDGKIYAMNVKNLLPYVERDPLLAGRFKNMKRIRERELILVIRAYNELHPLQFPVYE